MKRTVSILLASLLVAATLLVIASCGDRSAVGERTDTGEASTEVSSTDAALVSPSLKLPSSPAAEASASPSGEVAASPPIIYSGVKTYYSYLTPYEPPDEIYTRLSEGPLPELTTSNDYGMLLPYSNGELMGLVTKSGMIVTDPVFFGISQGCCYTPYEEYPSGPAVPAYLLDKVQDDFNEDDPWKNFMFGVCALDGSWITSFTYLRVCFTKEYIFLVINDEKNDIDVIDYSGRFLFNTKSLDCYSDMVPYSSISLLDGYGEDSIAFTPKCGGTAYINVLTGEATYTDYEQGQAFSEGMAAVKQQDLFGYINRNFMPIIEPQFSEAGAFYGGRSIVRYPDDSYSVIDNTGHILFSSPKSIYTWDNRVYAAGNPHPQFYNSDFMPIVIPGKIPGKELLQIGKGWLYCETATGVTVSDGNQSYNLPGVTYAVAVVGNLVSVFDSETEMRGVMTLDGKILVPLAEKSQIYLEKSDLTGEVYAIVKNNGSFSVIDASGNMLFSGKGNIGFFGICDLFEISNEYSFGYMDLSGNYVFRISLLDSLPD